ncbi:hypothetical protein BJX99DRAFT_261093 [Aspergillus californicus]
MASEPNLFLCIMAAYELASHIRACLSRQDLKALRLTCKLTAEGCTAGEAYLFQRVYVSAHPKDIEVLNNIAQHPHLAACVRELVYDASFVPNMVMLDDTGAYAVTARHRARRATDFLDACDGASVVGEDFVALVRTLPKFPQLQRAVVTELMCPWVPVNNSAWTIPYDKTSKYMSPAMRRFDTFQVRCIHGAELPPGHDILPTPENLVHLDNWAKALTRNRPHEGLRPTAFLGALRLRYYRVPLLLSTALATCGIHLKSYRVDKFNKDVDRRSRPTISTQSFDGYRVGQFLPESLLAPRFSDMFTTLKELSLRIASLDLVVPEEFRMRDILAHATCLETLHIQLSIEPGPGTFAIEWALPNLPSLKHMGLENFDLRMNHIAAVLMPWSFDNDIETLTLASCFFEFDQDQQDQYDEHYREPWAWLLAHDTRPAPTRLNMPLRFNVNSSNPEVELNTILDLDTTEASDSDSDYIPDSDESCDEEYESSDEEYYEPASTPPIELELPMGRLTVHEARRLPGTADATLTENVALVFHGEDWFCASGILRVFVDHYSAGRRRV